MLIRDKIFIVTGAASGMGAEVARELAEAGANVGLLDVNLDHAEAVAKEIGGIAVQCDVANAKSGEVAVKKLVTRFGGLHGCINCAGIAPAARVVSRQGPMPLADFDHVLQVNLLGAFNITRLCAAAMLQQQVQGEDHERGIIINTASVAAYDGQIGQAAYSAAKGGVVAMTLPIARELAKFAIRVVTIAPGVISTPMMANMPDAVQSSLHDAVLFPKRLGDPSEFASLVKEIIGNAYINATVIRLDGGLRMAAK